MPQKIFWKTNFSFSGENGSDELFVLPSRDVVALCVHGCNKIRVGSFCDVCGVVNLVDNVLVHFDEMELGDLIIIVTHQQTN